MYSYTQIFKCEEMKSRLYTSNDLYREDGHNFHFLQYVFLYFQNFSLILDRYSCISDNLGKKDLIISLNISGWSQHNFQPHLSEIQQVRILKHPEFFSFLLDKV